MIKQMRLMLAMMLVMLVPEMAVAATGTGLQWEGGLTTLTNSITGPIAFSISLIAIVIAGAVLAFGGELNQFARSIIILVLVIAVIVGATNFLSTLFGTTGAVIAAGAMLPMPVTP